MGVTPNASQLPKKIQPFAKFQIFCEFHKKAPQEGTREQRRPMRILLIIAVIAAVASCGRRAGTSQSYTLFASGPISQACLAADRKNASRNLCGCVQAVANQSLSQADQAKATRFFSNPASTQDARQSGSSFWLRYKAFANTAAQRCQA